MNMIFGHMFKYWIYGIIPPLSTVISRRSLRHERKIPVVPANVYTLVISWIGEI